MHSQSPTHLSRYPAGDFYPGPPLSTFEALYFSLTTIATVGYGDIHPRGTLSRSLVMCEILVGLIYVVFVFSIIAEFVRGNVPSKPGGG